MPHINEGIIRKKLSELRNEKLSPFAKQTIDQIEDLLDDRPRHLYIAKEPKQDESI